MKGKVSSRGSNALVLPSPDPRACSNPVSNNEYDRVCLKSLFALLNGPY